MLFGEPGLGKTLLARRLSSRWVGPVVHVTFPALPAVDLVAHLAEEFASLPSPPASLTESLRQLRGHLAATVAQGRRPSLSSMRPT